MTRGHLLRDWRVVVTSLLTVGMWSHLACPALADTGTLDITRVDVVAYPLVSLEVSTPARVAGSGLTASDFEVLENGISVPFSLTPVAAGGLEVVLLLDTSGSMNQGGAIGEAKKAAIAFLDALPPEVRVGVVGFSDTPSLVSPLSTDRQLLTQGINAVRARGKTSLYNGIVFAQSLFSGGTTDRQFVLLSDGGDTASTATLDQALAVTGAIRTSVIELVTAESNSDALAQLAAAANGSVSSATDPQALAKLYKQVANTLDNRYTLRLTSSARGPATYTVRVKEAKQTLEGTASAALPAAPAVTTVAPRPVVNTPATVDNASPVTVVAVAGGTTSGATSSPGALLVLGAIAFFASFVLLFLLVWSRKQAERAGRSPLFTDQQTAPDTEQSASRQLSDIADRFLDRRGRRRGLAASLDVAGIALRPGELLVIAVSLAVALAMVLLVFIGPVGLLIGLVIAPLFVRFYVSRRVDKRRSAFAEQLPDVLQLLVSSLRGGYGLPQALDALSNQCDEPARAEFQRIQFEIRIGRDPSDALAATATRMASKDFDWVVSAIQINREIGGELSAVLENVADTIRERQKMNRQIRVLTSEGRISAYVLVGLPIFLVAVLSVTNPDYFAPLRRSFGPLLVIYAVITTIVGWFWMRRLVKAQM